MRTRPIPLVALGLLFLTVAGCGGDDTVSPPPPPPTLQLKITAGDGQTGESYATLPVPLEVVVSQSDGSLVANRAVQWTVTGGGGVLSAASTQTDAAGHATVSLTLGRSGQQSVDAMVGGHHATFSETAVVPTKGVVLHYDGTQWNPVVQDTSAAVAVAYTISGTSASDIYVGGSACGGSMLLHYTGGAWPAVAPGCTTSFPSLEFWVSLAGASGTDMYGTIGRPSPSTGHVLRYDGQRWNGVYSAGATAKLWVSSANSVYAVIGSAVAHFDGTSWSKPTTPVGGLVAVWGDTQSSAAFAVGDQGAIIYYNGSAWQAQTSGTTQRLNAISGTSPSDVFAVGLAGTILHYDGTSWSSQTSGTTKDLTGVWASSSNSVVAVGDNTILHFDGSTWSAQTFPMPMKFNAVWGTSPTNVYAVGTGWIH